MPVDNKTKSRGIEDIASKKPGYLVPVEHLRFLLADGTTLINPFEYGWEQLIAMGEAGELWNPRREYSDIPQFAWYLKNHGMPTIKGVARKDENQATVAIPVEGHQRTICCVYWAQTQGENLVERIPFERMTVDSEIDRLKVALSSGLGRAWNPLEKAAIAARMEKAGLTRAEIAKMIPNSKGEMGVTTTAVNELITLSAATPLTQKLIVDNTVSASQVVDLIKEEGTPEAAERLLIEVATEEGIEIPGVNAPEVPEATPEATESEESSAEESGAIDEVAKARQKRAKGGNGGSTAPKITPGTVGKHRAKKNPAPGPSTEAMVVELSDAAWAAIADTDLAKIYRMFKKAALK